MLEYVSAYEGHPVVDPSGQAIGRLERIITPEATHDPAWAVIELESFSTRTAVPLVGAEPAGEALRVAYEKAAILDAPDVTGRHSTVLSSNGELYEYFAKVDGPDPEPAEAPFEEGPPDIFP